MPDTTAQVSEDIQKNVEDINKINQIKTHIARSRDYRDKFKTTWDEIEKQVRCDQPEAWAMKESWQTKVFIPLQAKKSETARGYLDKMLFGQEKFYEITGVETEDKERDGYLSELFDNMITRGGFFFENDYAIHESTDIGTSFMKVLVKDDADPMNRRLQFIWRSAYNILFDPAVGTNFYKSTYVIDENTVDISELIDEARNGTGLYSKATIDQFLAKGAEQAVSVSETDKTAVKGIDGTDVYIHKAYKSVIITEYWGKVKVTKKTPTYDEEGNETGIKETWSFQDRIVTLFNDTFLARDVENPYGFIPIFICRTKKRKYDTYGLGYLENGRGIQDLMNSMVNLGFDSLKISSMDIIGVDKNKVANFASIKYKPLAVWEFKDDPRRAMDRSRQGMSALSDIIGGIQLLDQIDQEASGVFRQAQGAPELAGAGSDTLGEYQQKMAMINQRFLKSGRFIERDYIVPMLKGIFKILTNPKFFNQVLWDRILGKKQVITQMQDPNTGAMQQVVRYESKLKFDEISAVGEMGLDFKAVGMTQFFSRLEDLSKLNQVLEKVIASPQLMVLSRLDKVWEKTLQAAEVPDYKEMLKSPEEVKSIMERVSLTAGQGAVAPPGGPSGRPR